MEKHVHVSHNATLKILDFLEQVNKRIAKKRRNAKKQNTTRVRIPKQAIVTTKGIHSKRERYFTVINAMSPKTYMVLRMYIIKLLNVGSYTDVVYAIRMLAQLFDIPIKICFLDDEVDIAYTNTTDTIYLNHLLFHPSFEKEPAHFERIPGVSHVALVILHEFGHILYGFSEEEADEFVNDFFRDIERLRYVLQE